MRKFSSPLRTSVPRALGNLRTLVHFPSLCGRIPNGFPTLPQSGKSRTNVTTTPEVFIMPKPLRCAIDPPSFNHEAHRALWLWLSENPCSWKADWPGWERYRNLPARLCFACQYAHDIRLWEVYTQHGKPIPDMDFPVVNCARCPLIWGDSKKFKPSCMSFYADWLSACLPAGARAIAARRIAEAPVRSGVEVI